MENFPTWDEWDDFAKGGFISRLVKFLCSTNNFGKFFTIKQIYEGLYRHWPADNILWAVESLSKYTIPKRPKYPEEFHGKRILAVDQEIEDYAVGIPEEYSFLADTLTSQDTSPPIKSQQSVLPLEYKPSGKAITCKCCV